MNVLEQIKDIKLVPVVTFKNIEEVAPTLDALLAGDVNCAEICFRTECAKDAIKLAINNYPNMLIGAGTVINKTQAIEAIELGVKFIVSPGFSEDVHLACFANNIPYLPGIVTPTEIMNAIDHGISVVKFFPAGVYGGLKAINALGAAFPQVKFMPTGGVDNNNLADFVANNKVWACGGSWLVKGNSEEIKNICLQARKIVKGE